MSIVTEFCEAAAAEVDTHKIARIDPATITIVFTLVTQGLIACQKAKNPGAAGANAFDGIQDTYNQHPVWSRNQIRNRIEDAYEDRGINLRNHELRELARAYLRRGFAETPERVAAAYDEAA